MRRLLNVIRISVGSNDYYYLKKGAKFTDGKGTFISMLIPMKVVYDENGEKRYEVDDSNFPPDNFKLVEPEEYKKFPFFQRYI